MTPISKERLAANIVNSPKRYSVKTLGIFGAIATIIALVPDADRAAMLNSLPIAPVWLPLIGAVLVYIMQVWPQFNLPIPAKPSDAAVSQTIDEAVPAPAPVMNETLAERREREDRELLERRALEDAEIAAKEAAAPMTEFAIDEVPSIDDDTVLEAIRQLAPKVSERNLEKIRFRAEQLRQEKLKSKAPLLSVSSRS